MIQNPNCPIAEHGLIGNTRTAALISKDGSLDWCCFPYFDSPGFFSSILDPETGGHFTITSAKESFSSQNYLEDTNVLKTTFRTHQGEAALIDCFTVDSEDNKQNELWPMHEVLRIVEGISGETEMIMNFLPKADYGLKSFIITRAGKLGLRCDLGNAVVYLHHDLTEEQISFNPLNNEVTAHFSLKAGDRIIFSLTYSEISPAVIPPLGSYALERFKRTLNYWRNWISKCKYAGEFSEEVRRSALALKLLVFAPSGALIAAPTTSLPESLQGERNWDYRYCWLRDASLTIRALVELGFLKEAKAYMSWILHSTSLTRPRLQVVYTVFGHAKIPEKILSHLTGYKHSSPVRIGNAADDQFQLDIYGEVMQGIFIIMPHMKKIDHDTVKFMTEIGTSVCELWDKKDEGIWEVRSGKQHHTHSKAMAWIALDRLIKMNALYNLNIDVKIFTKVVSELKEDLELYGYSSRMACYTSTYGNHNVDASLLMLPLLDYDPGKSERLLNTIRKIQEKLSCHGFVYRYLERDDGLKSGEGAFGACSFWMVEALARFGQDAEARELFQKLLDKRNDLNLWPEELNPFTGEFLGNYPQSFTHTALIGAALSLERGAAYGS